MRKIIIDTDTGSDDSVALMMCLREPTVQVLAVTTVSGNVNLQQATLNALQSIEMADIDCPPPVYMGADRPLMRPTVHANNVHGQDGMGDADLIHPTLKPVEGVHAADAIIQLVEANPYEVELAVIGPATNIALAMMKAPETMKKVKCIWDMGTCGFGLGNTSPVAEFNVYADAEAFKVMMDFGVHVYIGGYDLCVTENAWLQPDMDALMASSDPAARFAVTINRTLAEFCLAISGVKRIDLPDAVSLSPMLWPEVIELSKECVSYVCTETPETYGQVILYDGRTLAAMGPGFNTGLYGKYAANCTVIYKVRSELYKEKLFHLLTRRDWNN